MLITFMHDLYILIFGFYVRWSATTTHVARLPYDRFVKKAKADNLSTPMHPKTKMAEKQSNTFQVRIIMMYRYIQYQHAHVKL